MEPAARTIPPSPAPGTPAPILILIPIYNDWTSADALLRSMHPILSAEGLDYRILLVDDGSSSVCPAEFLGGDATVAGRTDVLELRCNLGHQRAIAVALAFIHARLDADTVVIMDGDGEDDPRDVPRLITRFRAEGGRKIIFAERRRRSERALFVMFYHLYRGAHLLLTGYAVRVGNFSVVPRALLDQLVVAGELWVHYAASVFKSKLPWTSVPTQRGRRLAGQSSMNFVKLVIHGLTAISVYGDIVGVRVLTANAVLIVLLMAGIAALIAVRTLTTVALPAWTVFVIGLLTLLLVQAIMISLIFIFMILSNRQGATFLPCRDYHHYVRALRPLRGRA